MGYPDAATVVRVQPTQPNPSSAVSDDITNVKATADQCGIAFLRALAADRDRPGPVDLDAFQDDFDRYLIEEIES